MACVWAAGSSARCERPANEIAPRENWSTFFCDQRVKLHFDIRSDQQTAGRFLWTHTVEQRTLSRGEVAVSVIPEQPTEAEISLQLPPLRAGLVMDTQLGVQLTDGSGQVLAELDRTIRLFSTDPFADRRQWLDGLDLVLFDPDGKTETVLDGCEIPYRSIRSISSISADSETCLLIGEGVSLQDHRTLSSDVTELAASGATVIFLAPADGSFPFPGGDEEQPKPRRVSMRQKDIIRELDKRLDDQAWPPDGQMIKSSLRVVSSRWGPELSVESSADHWPWVQAVYPSGGRLLVCGFGIIRGWDAGPTPRWLLLRILEQHKSNKGAPLQRQSDGGFSQRAVKPEDRSWTSEPPARAAGPAVSPDASEFG